jgi:hypothetical protein
VLIGWMRWWFWCPVFEGREVFDFEGGESEGGGNAAQGGWEVEGHASHDGGEDDAHEHGGERDVRQ